MLAFTTAATGIWGGYTAFGFTLFTVSYRVVESKGKHTHFQQACATLIIFGYYFFALTRQKHLYNRWAILGLEIFGTIFWLVSFSLCAEWATVYNGANWWSGHQTHYGGNWYTGLRDRSVMRRATNKYKAGVALTTTAAVLGALEL